MDPEDPGPAIPSALALRLLDQYHPTDDPPARGGLEEYLRSNEAPRARQTLPFIDPATHREVPIARPPEVARSSRSPEDAPSAPAPPPAPRPSKALAIRTPSSRPTDGIQSAESADIPLTDAALPIPNSSSQRRHIATPPVFVPSDTASWEPTHQPAPSARDVAAEMRALGRYLTALPASLRAGATEDLKREESVAEAAYQRQISEADASHERRIADIHLRHEGRWATLLQRETVLRALATQCSRAGDVMQTLSPESVSPANAAALEGWLDATADLQAAVLSVLYLQPANRPTT
jgi:hypothetical protein